MSTYLNCYEMVARIREGLNDYSTAKVQGTVTSGSYSNESIIRAINDNGKYIFDLLFSRMPHQFLTSTSLTASASVLTLPSGFFKLRRLEDANHLKVHPISVDGKHTHDNTGSKYRYYRTGNTLIIDADSVGDTFTLWYFTRPREITMGKASAGAATSITLATSARKEADYYNGMHIEDITKDLPDTISDYSVARVATITGTAAADDYYGLVSELPEEFHPLIYKRALLELRSWPVSPQPATTVDLQMFQQNLIETIRSYTGNIEHGDKNLEDVLLSLEPMS